MPIGTYYNITILFIGGSSPFLLNRGRSLVEEEVMSYMAISIRPYAWYCFNDIDIKVFNSHTRTLDAILMLR